ncbi:hypothetical protein MPER_09053, partial [Moniliophthora perniciosa FA553]
QQEYVCRVLIPHYDAFISPYPGSTTVHAGPITVFNKTIFDIIESTPDKPVYLHFMGVGLKAADESGNILGAFVSLILAILMLVVCFLFQSLSQKTFFWRQVRIFLADYGMPISLIASSAMAYWGRFNAANPETLPVGGAFQPANGREWLVRFWQLEVKWVGVALPFGIVLWILFFFDHNVSSLMAQSSKFPFHKPAGFHYDFFLLGVTTFIAGLIGAPATK